MTKKTLQLTCALTLALAFTGCQEPPPTKGGGSSPSPAVTRLGSSPSAAVSGAPSGAPASAAPSAQPSSVAASSSPSHAASGTPSHAESGTPAAASPHAETPAHAAPSAAPASGTPAPPADSGAPSKSGGFVPPTKPVAAPPGPLEAPPKAFASNATPDGAGIVRIWAMEDGSFKPGALSATAGKPFQLFLNNTSNKTIEVTISGQGLNEKVSVPSKKCVIQPVTAEAGTYKVAVGGASSSAALTVK